MPPNVGSEELETALRLLRKNSSLNAVSSYLKSKDLVHSASSWEVMRDERLGPALRDQQLKREDILQLLRDAEEYGRQRVFLYRCDRSEAAQLTADKTLRARLQRMKSLDLIDRPRILEMVPGLQLAEVRLELRSTKSYCIIKLVDVRTYMKQVSRTTEGDEIVIRTKPVYERAVHVLRICSDGVVDVRIQTHRNAIDYPSTVEEVFAKLAGMTDRLKYEEFSLHKCRRYLLENGPKLTSLLKFGAGTVRSRKGAPINFAAPMWGANLFDEEDEEVHAAMSALLAKGGGRSRCDIVNCIWLKQDARTATLGLASDIHTLIGGKNNEFWVVPQCSREDYQYVFEKIVGYAK